MKLKKSELNLDLTLTLLLGCGGDLNVHTNFLSAVKTKVKSILTVQAYRSSIFSIFLEKA